MSDPGPIGDVERRTIENEVSRFVADLERKSNRAGQIGCAWVLFVVIGLSSVRHTDGFATWMILSVVSFFVLGRYLARESRRSIGDFQNMFRATGGDARRREIALQQLWSLAHPAGRGPNKAAQKLLDALGSSARPPKPVVRESTEPLAAIAPKAVLVQLMSSRTSGAPPPIAKVNTATTPARTAPVAITQSDVKPSTTVQRAATPAVTTASTTAQRATTPAATTASATPPRAATPEAMVPGATIQGASALVAATPTAPTRTAPPAHLPAANVETPIAARSPATSSAAPVNELVGWRCDSCGTEARVPRAEANRLCPVCFPQIRLEV